MIKSAIIERLAHCSFRNLCNMRFLDLVSKVKKNKYLCMLYIYIYISSS